MCYDLVTPSKSEKRCLFVCLFVFYKTITTVRLDTVSLFHLAESEFLVSHITNSLNGLT